MDNNFVADVRLDDSDEVLQLPIVKNRLKRLLSSAVKKIATLGAPVIPSSDDPLDQFLQSAGKFFGKDPSKWEQVGEPKVEVNEEGGKRYTKTTGVFSGTELHLFVEPPYYDERLPVREDKPELNFNVKRQALATDDEWKEAIADQPWGMSKRRQALTGYLQAKIEADDGELAVEGCHGLWELAINKEHHADIRMDRLVSLLTKMGSGNIQVATVAAAAVWALATTSSCRRSLADLDVINIIMNNIKRTLKITPYPDVPAGETVPDGVVTDSQRATLQRHLLGALAVLLIDRSCRRPYLQLEQDFNTLFTLCKNLDGYKPADAQIRRETSAKVLTSMIQRDPEARRALVMSGALRQVLALLNPQGPGDAMIQFCMASLLATMVLDDEAMEMIRERGEAPVVFEACLVLLTSTLGKLHEELDRQMNGFYQDDSEPPVYDLALGVRLAEASAQAMWGSAHYCVMMSPIQIKMEHVEQLGKMGMDCVVTDQLPLSRVCHCITATMATLSSNPDSADLIMTCPNDLALQTLLTLVEVFETENFERAGHVKASACAGVAFLACHPIGAEGDECMHGPYRSKLLEMGAFGALLRAALTSVLDPDCDMVVQQAAAIGVMYLSTMAGAVDAGELAMYAALLMDSDNSEMIEFLMAGMWILLRNSDNRRVLGSSFSPNPANNIAKNMMNKLNDAITLHEIHDQAQEKAAMIRAQMEGKEGGQEQEEQEPSGIEDAEGDATARENSSPAAEEPGSSPAAADGGGESPDDAGLPTAEGRGSRAASAQGSVVGRGSLGGERGGSRLKLDDSEMLGGLSPEASEPRAASQRELRAPVEQAGAGPERQPSVASSSGAAGRQSTSRLHPLRQGSASVALKRDRSDARQLPAALADDENAASGGPGVPAHLMAAKRQAKDVKSKFKQLDKRFDKQLKDNWGLETLVTVGESWLPAMLEQDAVGEATDIPVLKLFEFLVASICLFMIEDEVDNERRELDMFRLSAPQGVRPRTWWTVDARAPEPQPIVEHHLERALSILIKIVGMRLNAAWKSLQLGVLTLWNACARNAAMERHVVQAGACIKLLDIVNYPGWPASLRDIAGGCLEFFCERYSNLGHFPSVTLPPEVQWPYQTPPTNGLVPVVAGYINLINSRNPLLEYRGCHGLARICYAAPYGAPDGKAHLKEAKAVSAVLGAIDAIISLMKRINRRYQDLLKGKAPVKKSTTTVRRRMTAEAAVAVSQSTEDDSALYEKDMTSLESMQDIFFVLFAALLNVSVLKSVQPMVAKKGLLVLLGTNTMLYGRTAAAEQEAEPSAEEKLLFLCSSIIQNISLHPQNRTRLYKAELKGSVALEKLIEDATEVEQDEELKAAASLLPPISPQRKPALNSRGGSPGGALGVPRRTTSPAKKLAANRPVRISPNGAVLNESVDTALAGTIRPKVIFPQIVERRDENVWGPSSVNMGNTGAPSGQRRMESNRTMAKGASVNPRSDSPNADASPMPDAMMAHEQAHMSYAAGMFEADGEVDSRNRFLNWLDNTFQQDGQDGASQGGAPFSDAASAGRKTYRKQLWDENGDWLDREPETAKTLNRLLCRPITHLWMESPEARARHGKHRWQPVVSEYREADGNAPLTRSAARLLSTQPPRDEGLLMGAASQMMATGKFETELQDQFTLQRPATRERQNGRMGLTVLRPNPELMLQQQREQQHMLQQQMGGMDTSSPGMVADRSGLETAGSSGGGPAGGSKAVPLKVCLGPQRARQVISFEDRILINDDPTRPSLTMFEHIDGSKVCRDMFPSYQLPNGRQAFMYYNGGAMLDEVHVDAVMPPPRPSTVPQALQQTMPLADVLNLIAKPPGSAPPFIPYKPVPYLVPLPPMHTLTVKRPDLWLASAFGDLREDNIQLVIQAKKIIKTQTTTRVEAVEVKPVDEREPWSLPNSIFKPRVKESDARGFFDNAQVEEKMFERDWQRACGKEKFTSMLGRENKANKAGKEDKAMLKEVHDVLLQYYQQWLNAFVYYAASGSGDPYHMPLNAYTTFLDDCGIADSESQFIKRSDCDTIFIVCNFQPDKKSAEAQVNIENAMMRYEFLESLVRAALAKYGKGQATDDVADAVRMLLENNVVTRLPPAALLVPNDFRTTRLYVEEVDLLFKRHAVLLKAIYSRYRLKPPGGGLRTKVLKLEGWLQLMNDAHMIDSLYTIQDAHLAFLWSRMHTIDEIKDYSKYTSLTFIDFLEALGRVADMKSLPADSDLEVAGYNNIMDWAIDKERFEGTEQSAAGDNANLDIFRPRESSGFNSVRTRPLYVKLEMLLDLMFRRLFWDPSSPDLPFNYDGLLKLIKKLDKDLGP